MSAERTFGFNNTFDFIVSAYLSVIVALQLTVVINLSDSYKLRHNNHMAVVFKQLAEDEAFMDVTLTAEGQPIKAHKSVLSAVSPYFSSVLRANPSQHPVIIMPWHVTFQELRGIVDFIYKWELENMLIHPITHFFSIYLE